MNTLNHEEMAQIEGGIAPVVIWIAGAFFGAAIAGTVSNVLDNWGEFKHGVRDGYNSTVASN